MFIFSYTILAKVDWIYIENKDMLKQKDSQLAFAIKLTVI